MKKTVFVTGGAGFIGSCLVRKLNDCGLGEIIIVDRLDSAAKEKNLAGKKYTDFIDKEEFLEKIGNKPSLFAGAAAVFHLGACSSTLNMDEAYLKKNNTDYTIALAQWTAAKDIRFIYASSAATYGDGGKGFRDDIASLEALTPLNPYGRSKHDFDLWAKKSGLFKKILGIKFFNVFGPNEYHKEEMRSVIHKAFPGVKQKGVMRLFKSYRPDYGHGEQKRDFIYIKDALDVCVFFYEQKKLSGLFNLGTGRAETWNAIARAMFRALGKKPVIEYMDMPEELKDKYQYFTEADMTALRSAGYKKDFMSIEDSVGDYITSYLDTDNPYY